MVLIGLLLAATASTHSITIDEIPVPVVLEAPSFQEGDNEEVLVSVYELRNAVYQFQVKELYVAYSDTLFDLLKRAIVDSEIEHKARLSAEAERDSLKKVLIVTIPSSIVIVVVLTLVLILK